jgi:hypothetical protein
MKSRSVLTQAGDTKGQHLVAEVCLPGRSTAATDSRLRRRQALACFDGFAPE